MIQFAKELCYETAEQAFTDMYDYIMQYGLYNHDYKTKMIFNVGFYIKNPNNRLINVPWRNWKPTYAEREWKWYLSQNRLVKEIKKYAPLWDKMHGGDNIVNSNYGWQWGRENQLDKCIEQIKKDRYTRQAWISIFDGKEKSQYKYDTPCTMAIGFYVSPADIARVNMCVLMRSNDLIYGFCNDQYCFSKLLSLVADELNMEVGSYYHFAQNLHIYNQHFNLKELWEKKNN